MRVRIRDKECSMVRKYGSGSRKGGQIREVGVHDQDVQLSLIFIGKL